MVRPFRFGVQAAAALDAEGWRDLAVRAEDLGYDTLTVPDHFDEGHAPTPALSYAAACTSTLRLGTLVLANDFRHPCALAKEAATLDVLSQGRFELGIGAGWQTSDYTRTGIIQDRAGVRIDRLGEAVAVLKGLFGEGEFSFAGEHYRVAGLRGEPRPVQPGGPPLFMAGGSPKVLALAARCADIVGVNPSMAAGVIDERAGPSATVTATQAKVAALRAAAPERFDGLELHSRVHVAAVTADPWHVAEAVAPALGISPAEALDSPHSLVGSVEQVVEKLQRVREQLGISYFGWNAQVMRDMAPVVAKLNGT